MTLSYQLRPVIKLIDDLKDCGIDSKISLPRIAVIGSQSSGKSSLLESIVGYDFLPRGEGTVTRRPLELRLVHVDDETFQPYAVFSDDQPQNPEAKIKDFDRVRQKIEEKTNQVAGTNRNIVEKPIVLTIYSNDCPDLTLVDLPGITRVPMKNSGQPDDIERITTEMTEKYIQDKMTIILCVIPVNADISTADSIKLAKKHDPEGKRTLGVLTKIDIMDKGTSALPILKNQVIHLYHGYVAVKNRSQADINAKVKVKQALDDEQEFFDAHSEYRALSNSIGTPILSRRLTTLLYEHIQECLPKIEKDIFQNLDKYEKELFHLGDSLPSEDSQKLFFFIKKAKEVGKLLEELVESKVMLPGKTFQGFGDFNLQVSKFQKEKNALLIDSLRETPIAHVILDMIDLKGISLPGFLPKEIIERKVQYELEKLKIPVRTFIEDVKKHDEYLLHVAFDMTESLSSEIKSLLRSKSLNYLEYLARDVKTFIDRLIDVEKQMIWTHNSKFFLSEETEPSIQDANLFATVAKTNPAVQTPVTKLQRAINFIKQEIPEFSLTAIEKNLKNLSSSSNEGKDYKPKLKQITDSKMDITNLVSTEEIVYYYEKLVRYYSLINRSLSDTIPKIIGADLIKKFYNGLEEALLKSVNENIGELYQIKEDPSIQKRRENCRNIMTKLQNSKNILNTFHAKFATDLDWIAAGSSSDCDSESDSNNNDDL